VALSMSFVNLLEPLDAPLTAGSLGLELTRFRSRFH
jgi:hypothetical protein